MRCIVVCICYLQCSAGLSATPSVDHTEHTIQRRKISDVYFVAPSSLLVCFLLCFYAAEWVLLSGRVKNRGLVLCVSYDGSDGGQYQLYDYQNVHTSNFRTGLS